MLRTSLLATTALVVGASLAMAGGFKAPPKAIPQQQHKGLIATVKHNGIANQGIIINTNHKGAVHNVAPHFVPGTYNNLSSETNAQFVSWYGFYASNSCYSYYYSSNYHYFYCFSENTAVPITGAGKKAKTVSVPVYRFAGTFDVSILKDSGGLPGNAISIGSVSGVSTSYCCSALQTAAMSPKKVLAAATPFWVNVTSNGGGGLWLTEDSDYSVGQPYDFHYSFFETYNFGSGTYTYSSTSGWLASTASPFRPALKL
jgi:hypothetical protein